MIGQLSDRVVPAVILPAGLLCCKPFHGYVDGHEPVFLVVGAAQLLQQDAPQRRWLGVLRGGVKDGFYPHSPPAQCKGLDVNGRPRLAMCSSASPIAVANGPFTLRIDYL